MFYDFPTDIAALQAAMVARHLPPERYERFIDTLFAAQDRWVFGAGSVPDVRSGRWRATPAWTVRRSTGRSPTPALQDWIVGRALRRRVALARGCHPQFRDQRTSSTRGPCPPVNLL